MTHTFKPSGVCSQLIELELEGDIITDVRITGGCSGNLQGIVKLVVGCKAQDVVNRLSGIHCGSKETSCPDQLAQAILQAMQASA